jgi:hypothetical protein
MCRTSTHILFSRILGNPLYSPRNGLFEEPPWLPETDTVAFTVPAHVDYASGCPA